MNSGSPNGKKPSTSWKPTTANPPSSSIRSICNSSAKGDKIFHLGQFVHPYTQKDDDPKFKFFTAVSDNPADTWHVVLDRDPAINPGVDNTIKAFGLDEIYDMHCSLEVKDMMDFAQAYNGTYLHMIYNLLQSDL